MTGQHGDPVWNTYRHESVKVSKSAYVDGDFIVYDFAPGFQWVDGKRFELFKRESANVNTFRYHASFETLDEAEESMKGERNE